jgi:hypothetical protein
MLSWKVLLGLSRLADRIIKKKIFFQQNFVYYFLSVLGKPAMA